MFDHYRVYFLSLLVEQFPVSIAGISGISLEHILQSSKDTQLADALSGSSKAARNQKISLGAVRLF